MLILIEKICIFKPLSQSNKELQYFSTTKLEQYIDVITKQLTPKH
jgi:hypothetical protein